jgi:hypothetical protein
MVIEAERAPRHLLFDVELLTHQRQVCHLLESRACEHAFVTSQGSLRRQFQHAFERGNALDAIAAAAKSMGGLSLWAAGGLLVFALAAGSAIAASPQSTPAACEF